MRINKFIAQTTGISRRAADRAIIEGRVQLNNHTAQNGAEVSDHDLVSLDGVQLNTFVPQLTTIVFNKPRGYVVSRDGQGSKTIYDIIPTAYHHLKPVGRLDKASSGLLLLTNDGQLAHQLSHPSFEKLKIYEVAINKPLQPLHHQMIHDFGIQLEDGLSKLELERINEHDNTKWRVRMREGRNRQIRRTFAALGYEVTALHRTNFGPYALNDLNPGGIRLIPDSQN